MVLNIYDGMQGSGEMTYAPVQNKVYNLQRWSYDGL